MTSDVASLMALQFHQLNTDLQADGYRDGEGLTRLVQLAVVTIPRCDWATVITRSGKHEPVTVAFSAEPGRAVDTLQIDESTGPSIDAVTGTEFISATDLRGDERWPRLTLPALTASPVNSAIAFHIGDSSLGAALTLYSADPAGFADEAFETGGLFATHARTLMMHATALHKCGHLTEALSTSRMIGAAVGILMLGRRVTVDEAFNLLRDASQRLHVKLRLVAEDVTRTGELPELPVISRSSKPASDRPLAPAQDRVAGGGSQSAGPRLRVATGS